MTGKIRRVRSGPPVAESSSAASYSAWTQASTASATGMSSTYSFFSEPRAKTDPEPLPSEEKGLEARPEADNLVGIYAALSGRSKADVLGEFGGGQFSNFKNALVELCVAKLSPIASEMKRLVADPGHVDAILIDGADRARAIAAETMKATKDIVGFVRRR